MSNRTIGWCWRHINRLIEWCEYHINRLMGWCRRHIIRTNLIVLGVEVIAACLIWFKFGGSQTFGPPNTYVIVCLSVVIASIAALNSMFASVTAHDSLTLTSKSLELTRNAVRPFLSMCENITVDMSKDIVILKFKIRNSGSLPASEVHTDIDFFAADEQVKEDNVSEKYSSPQRESEVTLVFPNNHYYEEFSLNLNDKDDGELWNDIKNAKVKFRVRTIYRSLDRKYETIQTEQIVKLKGRKELQLIPISPQKSN